MTIIYLPAAEPIFHTRALTGGELPTVTAASLAIIVWVDAEKILHRLSSR